MRRLRNAAAIVLLANQTGALLANTGMVLKLTPAGGEDEN
jgi:hypothetical protein